MATHNATTHTIPQSGYIRRFRLAELLGVSVSTIDRKVRNGVLPRPVKLGDRVRINDYLFQVVGILHHQPRAMLMPVQEVARVTGRFSAWLRAFRSSTGQAG